MSTFTIGETDFLLNGEPHQIIAGALHYFRVHPGQWRDRIRKARAMGLNAIETYIAWNAHEPVRGQWDATGGNDIGRFLDLVAEEGMHAIVRPGPYICAEWHNGGLPVWLTSMPGVGLRRSEPQYLAALSDYLRRVYEIVAPRQIDRGGNVILVQIENEYGAYGDDADYLRALTALTRECGITVPLTTVDQPQPDMLAAGTLPELHTTGSFGSRAEERLQTLRMFQPTGPLMCSEFWDGWFDWWSGVHHTTPAEVSARELDTLLAAGASVSIYMFHGGTNFGTTAGGNDKGRYAPIVTSYDYDAPLNESGSPTEKYIAFREVISRYRRVEEPVPAPAGPAPEVTAPLRRRASVLAQEPGASAHTDPPTFEQLGHIGPLLRYDATLPHREGGVLVMDEVRDDALVLVDGIAAGRLSRTHHDRSLQLPPGHALTILVEAQGRVNYGSRLGEAKGLIGPVRLDESPVQGWSAQAIHLDALREASASADDGTGPAVYAADFSLASSADLFLDTAGFGRGFAYVNGFFLGRYSRSGPQRTLYVPEPVTRTGQNELVLVELAELADPIARFVAEADLGPVEE